MEKEKNTVLVNIDVELDEKLERTVRCFFQSLEYIESLYHLENSGELSLTLENAIFQKIIIGLKSGASYLSDQDRFELERQIDALARGIYDLFTLTLTNQGREYIDLILGKVFSLDKNNRRFYSGVVGIINNSFDDLVKSYDSKLDLLQRGLPRSSTPEGFSIKKDVPKIRCIDVLSLAGELNTRHKPICVFFSGRNSENLSTLSRMTVFINLYVRRFELMSKEIAKRYIEDYPIIENLGKEATGRLLLLWLRGHDLGHFYGEDLLGARMSELDKSYLILHELKSDLVSLYNLRFLADDLLKGNSLIRAYIVSIAEMFRYIRRGRFYNYPDTGSAFLTYSYLRHRGSIRFNRTTEKFKVDFDSLEIEVERLAEEVLNIFAEGDVTRANKLLNRWGNIKELGQSNLPDELQVLEDTSVPHYIDLNSKTRDKILLGLS